MREFSTVDKFKKFTKKEKKKTITDVVINSDSDETD